MAGADVIEFDLERARAQEMPNLQGLLAEITPKAQSESASHPANVRLLRSSSDEERLHGSS